MSQLRKRAIKCVGRAWSFAKCQSLKLAVSVEMFAMNTGTMLVNSKDADGFSKTTTEISSYQTPISNLMEAITVVIVLVKASNVYFKMQNSDQGVKKAIVLTIGGCVAPAAMSETLPFFFK